MPEPVTPWSRNGAKAPSARRRSPSSAAACAGVSARGAAAAAARSPLRATGVSRSSRTSAAPRERGERGAPARERGAELLDGDPAAGEQVLEDRALRPARARARRAASAARRLGRGVLDAAARGRGGAPARVEAGRQRRAEQLAGRDEVVLLRPADELDELRRERRDRVEDLGDVAQREAVRRRAGEADHVARRAAALAERHRHALPERDLRRERRRDAVREGAAHRGGDGDLDEHGGSVASEPAACAPACAVDSALPGGGPPCALARSRSRSPSRSVSLAAACGERRTEAPPPAPQPAPHRRHRRPSPPRRPRPRPPRPPDPDRDPRAPDPDRDRDRDREADPDPGREAHSEREAGGHAEARPRGPAGRGCRGASAGEARPAGRDPGARAGGQHEKVGDEKCKMCHRVQHQSWAASPHAAKGLDCEGCHGNGGDYWQASVMRDRAKATAAGLVMPGLASCKKCHANADAALFAKVHAHKAK